MGSNPAVGSSYRITCGLLLNARAMATRFFIPPLSSAGIASGISNPTNCRLSITLCSMADSSMTPCSQSR